MEQILLDGFYCGRMRLRLFLFVTELYDHFEKKNRVSLKEKIE